MRRLNVIELSDGERAALLAKIEERDGPEHMYDLPAALSQLAPTAEPAITLTALRKIAEGTGAAAGWAREALEKIGDRVSADAPEGPVDPDIQLARAREDPSGGDFG